MSGASVYALRGGAYVALLLAPGAWSLWGFVVIMGFSWWATLPLTSALTAEVYGLKHLGILNGLAFTGHQLGGALSTQLGGTLRDLTGSYDLPFAIAALLLFGASLVSFALREQRYSTRYQPTASGGLTWHRDRREPYQGTASAALQSSLSWMIAVMPNVT